MSTPLAPFPDVEALGVAWLADLAPTGVETPAELGAPGDVAGDVPEYIRFLRVGGDDDGLTDRPLVEVACFGPTRARARQLGEAVRQRVLAAGGAVVAGVLIDYAATTTGPTEVPEQNPDVRVHRAYYVIEYRRPRA